MKYWSYDLLHFIFRFSRLPFNTFCCRLAIGIGSSMAVVAEISYTTYS